VRLPHAPPHGNPAPLHADAVGVAHACLYRYIEFQNTYKIDSDKMNYKDQSTTILTKSYYTKNPLF
jgi:hypothetical protein